MHLEETTKCTMKRLEMDVTDGIVSGSSTHIVLMLLLRILLMT